MSGKGALRLFQYISCCSLSYDVILVAQFAASFNTPHVVVYLTAIFNLYSKNSSFNTSHVVVYQEVGTEQENNNQVSIHLML